MWDTPPRSGKRPVFSFLLSNDTLEARAFFQRRLASFAALIALLTAGFYIVGATLSLVQSTERLVERVSEPRSVFHLLAMVVAGAVAFIVGRRRELSARALEFYDFLCTDAVCTCFALVSLGSPLQARGDLLVLLAISYILVIRAAMVPSNALRSALIAAECFLPAIAVTFLYFRNLPPIPDYISPALHVLVWSALGTVATASISKVIYGLQRQVNQAMKVGQYTLVEKIGEGGMGVVYRAKHALLRRPTAIKLLVPDETGDVQALTRFEREVQLTSQLTHANTIAIYDFGRTSDGIFYYAMEYLDGITLQVLVEEYGPQPPARVAHILRQVCGALHEAHLLGLIHRDIKPANIMIGKRGAIQDVVKVLDFGLVRQISRSEVDTTKTNANIVMGTPAYLAPEAITDSARVDGRADLYALGATGYLLLTGCTVFDGKTVVDICGQHVHEQPKTPSQRLGTELPPGLEGIILKCLEKNQDRRPQSAAILAEALAASDAGSWMESDACAWWNERAPLRRSSPSRPESVLSVSIVVDMDRRTTPVRAAGDETFREITRVDRLVAR